MRWTWRGKRQNERKQRVSSGANREVEVTQSEYSREVERRLRRLDASEIESQVRDGSFTPEAHAVALRVLADMGVDTQSMPTEPPTIEAPEPSGPLSFIDRCMRGEERLWRAYWLLGLIVGLLQLPGNIALQFGRSPGLLWVMLISLPSTLLWCVAVWRCAFRSSHWLWGVIARGIAALGFVISLIAMLRTAQLLYWQLVP